MYLSTIRLWNFRKFGSDTDEIQIDTPHLSLDFKKGVNLLVGENDSGKSGIVDAIKLVLKTHTQEWLKVEEDDFYHGSNHLRIECIFRSLEDDIAKNFTEWLGVESTTNRAGQEEKVPYLRLMLDVKKTPEKILPFEIRAGADNEGRILSAEAKEYLRTTYLKPLRDAEGELIARKNSRLSQILYAHPVFKDKVSHELISILSESNQKIKDYFEDETNKDTNGYVVLETLKDYLTKFLKKNSPQNTNFQIDNPRLKNILEILKLTLYDDCCGLGTYNLLFIAAEMLHLKQNNFNGLKLGLIEEVEAHLHPQAQLRVMTALEKEVEENGVQLILSTHSPNLASKVPVENLILCYEGGVYPLGSDYTKLEKTDYRFLKRFLDVTKANLFFAQGVLLVEGDAENILIPTLAKLIGKDLASHGVSIVNVGGLTFLRYSRIFQRQEGYPELRLPVAIITDLDVKPVDENAQKAIKIRTIKAKYNGVPVKTFVSPHQTLEYSIARSATLRELLFEAIKLAGVEMDNEGYTGKLVNDTWASFSHGVSDIALAEKIYKLLIKKGRGISKAITAQYLAESLEKKITDDVFIAALRNDTNIKYLIEAINYASSNSDN